MKASTTNRCPERSPRTAMARLLALVAVLASTTLVCGCSSTTTGAASTGGNPSQGGTVSAAGGVATGGSLATGATSASGGISAVGGTPSTGGSTATGGFSPAPGGTTALGGSTSSGGATASGGSTNSGGVTPSGGGTGSGGATSSGGATASGGGTNSRGGASSGGATSLGGSTSSGGESQSGGSTSSGGVAGQSGTGGASGGTSGGPGTGPSYPYIFSCFNDSAPSSDLIIYTSNDGLNFTLLYDTGYVGPSGYLRDPSIMKHTDGKFYLAFTTPPDAGCCGPQTSFAIASSSNLKDWTTVTQVPSGIAGVNNVWAPEWFKDTDGTIHILVSINSSTTYRYEPTDNTLTKWGTGTKIGMTGVIDTFMVKVGDTYHSFSKGSYVQHGTAPSLDGPWTYDGISHWPGCKEAPAVIGLPDGTWRLFCDAGGGGHEKSSDGSADFKTWTTATTLPNVGNNISHGTVIKGN